MARNVKAARTAAVASGRGAAFKARVALAACKGDKTLGDLDQSLAATLVQPIVWGSKRHQQCSYRSERGSSTPFHLTFRPHC
jgi:hypothetical protein